MLAQIDSSFIWVPLKFHAEAFMTDDSGILAGCYCRSQKWHNGEIATMLPSLFKILMSALKLSGAEIRQAFLDFYSQRGHQPLPSGSLVPEDPTVLLTIGN